MSKQRVAKGTVLLVSACFLNQYYSVLLLPLPYSKYRVPQFRLCEAF